MEIRRLRRNEREVKEGSVGKLEEMRLGGIRKKVIEIVEEIL